MSYVKTPYKSNTYGFDHRTSCHVNTLPAARAEPFTGVMLPSRVSVHNTTSSLLVLGFQY